MRCFIYFASLSFFLLHFLIFMNFHCKDCSDAHCQLRKLNKYLCINMSYFYLFMLIHVEISWNNLKTIVFLRFVSFIQFTLSLSFELLKKKRCRFILSQYLLQSINVIYRRINTHLYDCLKSKMKTYWTYWI